MNLVKVKYKKAFCIVCAILSVSVLVGVRSIDNYFGTNSSVHIGAMRLPVSSLLGAVQTFLFLFCVLMTCVCPKIGSRISVILLSLTAAFNLFGIFATASLSPLPGILNSLIFIPITLMIAKQFDLLTVESHTDYVTKLTNMRGFLEIVEGRISEKKPTTIVYLRIANFRLINDNLGHDVGDELLRTLGNCFSQTVSERGIVCKTGGTEFAVITDRKIDEKALCDELMQAVGERLKISYNGSRIYCYPDLSAGAAKYPDDADDGKTLLRYVDMALLRATKQGHGSVCIFNHEMQEQMFRESAIEGVIKDCLDNDYFYLVYQPQYDIQSHALRGFETLIRIKAPGDTSISTGEMIQIAERSDLILKIDEYVLRRAMREFAHQLKREHQDLTMSVNISANSMAREDFAERVRQTLEQTGFPAGNLELEITEYSFAESEDHTVQNIEALKRMGVKIALDDFGTGYTSLSQLMKLPIDLLKIDKSLVDELGSSEKNRDLVSAVIYMGHLMQCDVISEGVETPDQLELLKEENCDYVQGYVLNRPLNYDVIMDLLEHRNEN